MKANEFIERVKSVIAAFHAKKGKRYERGSSLYDFEPEIRRLQDGVDRVEAGGPTPQRTSYSAETVEWPGDTEEVERHESFGLVGFSRVQGSAHLFGSHLERHHHFIVLRVFRAQRTHSSLGYDRYSTDGRVPIVEVELSAAQFAEAITTLNAGEGVPCTIRSVEGCPMEPVPEAVAAESVKIRAGFSAKVAATVKRAEEARREFAKIVESGTAISKGRAKDLLGVLDHVVMDLKDNAPFMVEQFQESAEKVVAQAKAEIEAFTTHAIVQAGLERIAEQRTERLAERLTDAVKTPRGLPAEPVELEPCPNCGDDVCGGEGCSGDET